MGCSSQSCLCAKLPRVYDLQIPSIQQVTKKRAAFLIYVHRREIPGVNILSVLHWGVRSDGRQGTVLEELLRGTMQVESQNGLGGTSKGLLVQTLAMSRDIFIWIRSLRASSGL